jgi:hypothetical protein
LRHNLISIMPNSLSCPVLKKASFEWHFRAIDKKQLPVIIAQESTHSAVQWTGSEQPVLFKYFLGEAVGVRRNARKFVDHPIRVKLPQAVGDEEHPEDLQATR